MKKLSILFVFLLISGIPFQAFNQEDCAQPTAFEQLDINNVRANYYNNGSDWINQHMAFSGYEIPKDAGTHSIFAGGFWLGGINELQELRMTGRMYRMNNFEYSLWPGPMNNLGAGEFITPACTEFDQIYKLNRSEVVLHRLYFEMLAENDGVPPTATPFENGYTIPDVILNWPTEAEVLLGQSQELAPYFDNDCCGGTPGVYEPELGDYPAFRFPDNEEDFDCEQHLLGDQVLWWVVNNAYSGLPGMEENDFLPTGFEIHNLAYAYISDDHINNITFLRRTLINRSGWEYEDMYLGQFIDVDLGGSQDDYFGSDVDRGMAYYYNGDNNDENDQGAFGYGISPPAIGFDFVGGPLADENDGIDNDWNGVIDEPGERHRMDYAVYFNNDGNTVNGNPSNVQLFYNYLRGIWMNDSTITYGGDGTSDNPDAIPCQFMFPGDSDPLLINTGGVPVEPWTEMTENNPPGDRRNVMSSGPFTFSPDEKKVFTLAIPWAREEGCEEVPCSLDLLREADDLAQELHDNCYEMPCMVLDAQFEIEIENGQAALNSPITSGIEYHWTFGDGEEITTEYPFASHEYTEAGDFSVCLEIDFGCGTSSTCEAIGGLLCDLLTGPQITQIEGTGNTHHYFELTDETIDAILENDSNMVLHPSYKKGKGPVKVLVYDLEAIEEGDYTLKFDGIGADANWKMFIQGTTDTVYSNASIGTPHTQFIDVWGLMVSVDAHLSDETSAPIGSNLIFENENTPWLGHVEDTDDFTYQNWIREGTVTLPCFSEDIGNCYFSDSSQSSISPCLFDDIQPSSDSDTGFENLVNGGWSPSHYVPKKTCHPYFDGGAINNSEYINPGQIRNVDIILTQDKNEWTRSGVLDVSVSDNSPNPPSLRNALSVDKNGRNQNHPDCNTEEATFYGQQTDEFGMSYGMGWFPGYAIDVNTGKRLNIVFGENPELTDDNGDDMVWNPTSKMWNDDGSVCFGGSHSIIVISNHYIYNSDVTLPTSQYDGCQDIFEVQNSPLMNLRFSRKQQWTGLPILNEGFEMLPIEEGLIPTETTIQLRLRHRYQNYLPDVVNINNGNPLYNFTIDYEDLISSIEEVHDHQEILVFPNPARDQLSIRLNGFEIGTTSLEMFDMSGKMVKREIISTTGLNQISTSNLKNGVYVIRILTSVKTPQFKRVIITH